MMKQTIRDIREFAAKRVLVRVDFNVPLSRQDNSITDNSRIRESLPTIQYLINRKAKVIICSHLGRPDGKVVEKLKMLPIAKELANLIHLPVKTVNDCIGSKVTSMVDSLKAGEILVLENLRFHAEEEANDPAFAQKLAQLADIYVDDAFGTAHRAHASTEGVAHYLPAYAGFLMEKELNSLGHILATPRHPFAALLGGAKASDKINLIKNILDKVDMVLIGGGMAATFLKNQGCEVGRSLIEPDKIDLAHQLVVTAQQNNIAFLFPVDVMVSDRIDVCSNLNTVSVNAIPPNAFIVDIGTETIELFSQQLKTCQTIFWNGPMGIYEVPEFSHGTREMMQLIASRNMATTVIGGGSTAEIAQEMGLVNKLTHVSTGGGASLQFLEGEKLPGVEVLLNKDLIGGVEKI